MSDEGDDIGNRVQLQKDVDGQQEFVKAGLFLTHGVGDRLNFWEGGWNVVVT